MSGPVPARVDGTAKTTLLELIDDAVAAGWTHSRVCTVLGVDRRRAWRWTQRRADGTLDDARPGGRPIHSLLGSERDEIMALFDEWGHIDRSHRKLAHRGSYLGRVWVSPSTVDRVLAGHGLALAGTPRPAKKTKTPWPNWCEWRPNQLWCWDGTQFPACKPAKHAYAIVDVVSRKWIATHLTTAPDSVAARVLFAKALQSEQLLTDEAATRLDNPNSDLPDNNEIPLLLAVTTTDRRCAQVTPPSSWPCAQSPNTSDGGQHPPTKPGSSLCSATSKANTPTSKRLTTPQTSPENSNASAATTTRCGSTKASAMSPPTTNTPDKATRSAKHAATDSTKPTRNDAPSTETNR